MIFNNSIDLIYIISTYMCHLTYEMSADNIEICRHTERTSFAVTYYSAAARLYFSCDEVTTTAGIVYRALLSHKHIDRAGPRHQQQHWLLPRCTVLTRGRAHQGRGRAGGQSPGTVQLPLNWA